MRNLILKDIEYVDGKCLAVFNVESHPLNYWMFFIFPLSLYIFLNQVKIAWDHNMEKK